MSAPSQTPQRHEGSVHTPTFGSLLRAELLRIRSRRFARWMVVALFLVMALVTGIEFTETAKPTDAQVRTAQLECTLSSSGEYFTDGTGGVFDPYTGRPIAPPDNVDISDSCDSVAELVAQGAFSGGTEPAVPSAFPEWFLGIGLGVAVLVFIFGCTLGGADWSNRTMPALLFWEPRRVRVYVAKLIALGLSVTALLAFTCVLWVALYSGLISVHGVWDDNGTGLVGDSMRGVLAAVVLCAVASLLGFGIANLTRNTGAALGAAFVYFAIIEQAAGWFVPSVMPWLFTLNLGALVTSGGIEADVNGTVVMISSLRGALTLLGYAAVVNLAAFGLFQRRDVT